MTYIISEYFPAIVVCALVFIVASIIYILTAVRKLETELDVIKNLVRNENERSRNVMRTEASNLDQRLDSYDEMYSMNSKILDSCRQVISCNKDISSLCRQLISSIEVATKKRTTTAAKKKEKEITEDGGAKPEV